MQMINYQALYGLAQALYKILCRTDSDRGSDYAFAVLRFKLILAVNQQLLKNVNELARFIAQMASYYLSGILASYETADLQQSLSFASESFSAG